jgi:pimeloyl-ACP methyl ester carboxylesterase
MFDYEIHSFVMLDRGSCSFVTKARNAQKIGAKAVIIINSNDDDINDFKVRFNNIEFQTVLNAGHWVHAEKPIDFFNVVKNFITN